MIDLLLRIPLSFMEVLQLILGITVVAATLFFILKLANVNKEERHKQWTIPLAAFVAVVYALVKFKDLSYIIQNIIEMLNDSGALSSVFGNMSMDPASDFAPLASMMFAFFVVFMFAIAKFGLNRGSNLIKGVFKKLSKKDDGKISKFSVAYRTNQLGNPELRPDWYFPSLFAKYAVFIGGGILLLTIILIIAQVPFVPGLVALAVLVLLEMFWYLQGSAPGYVPVENEDDKTVLHKPVDYLKLWQEYKTIWKDNLLLAWHYGSPQHTNDDEEEFTSHIAQKVLLKGFPFTKNDEFILENLEKRKDIVIGDSINNKIAPTLISVLLERLMHGEHILVVTPKMIQGDNEYNNELTKWFDDWLALLSGNENFWNAQLYNRVIEPDITEKLLVCSSKDLLQKDTLNKEWFSFLTTVIYINGDEIFSESLTFSNILINVLRSESNNIHSIVLSDFREGFQPAVMRNLSVEKDLVETRVHNKKPKKSYAMFWRLEGERLFQSKVMSGYISRDLGAEAVLALLAIREKIKNVQMVDQEMQPWYEYLEELDNNKSSLTSTPVSPDVLKQHVTKLIKSPWVENLLEQEENNFILARDNDYNLINSYRKWEGFSTNTSFVHVVSPPYLFREYFIDNVHYFVSAPINAIAGKLMKSRFSVAIYLLELMVLKPLTDKQIMEEINQIYPNAKRAKDELAKLFKLAFNIDIVSSNYLKLKTKSVYNKRTDTFEDFLVYSFSPNIKSDLKVEFLKDVKIMDKAGMLLRMISYDFLYQNYLIDQLHSFNGKPYLIRSFDFNNQILRVTHETPRHLFNYRPNIEINLRNISNALTPSHSKNPKAGVHLTLAEASYNIVTKGYFTFREGVSLQTKQHNYTDLQNHEIPIRDYNLGRLLIWQIKPSKAIDNIKVGATLTALLRESFYTLLPKSHSYLHITSPTNEGIFDEQFKFLFPTLNIADNFNITSDVQLDDRITILFFEDAHQDLGLVQSIYDNWEEIIKVIDDYLEWINEPKQTNKQSKNDTTEYIKGKFLKDEFLTYGSKSYPNFADLRGCKTLLTEMLGKNQLSLARKDFFERNKPEAIAKAQEAKGIQCDFCAKTYVPKSLKKLKDKRIICNECIGKSVNSMTKLKKILRDSKAYFEVQSNQKLPQNIQAGFTKIDILNQMTGQHFESTPAYDYKRNSFYEMRNNYYTLYLENGAPHQSAYAAMVYEISKVWLLTQTNYDQIILRHGKTMVEGFGLWCMIDALEKNRLAPELLTELTNLQGEMGKGYRTIKSMLKINPNYNNAFDLFKKEFSRRLI